jgi:hypothetical protein
MYKLICLFSFLFILLQSQAQYQQLDSLPGHHTRIYFSKGADIRANYIAGLVDSAYSYYTKLLNFSPEVELLVLSEADWKTYTNMPVVGMPHYDNTNNRKLVVAAGDNPLWRSFLPPLDRMDSVTAKRVREVYTMADGTLSMAAFFDLLAVHELAHAYHMQAGVKMQRQWMAELFVNMMLHNFVATYRPDLLPALTVFPQMVLGQGSAQYKFKQLHDIEDHYQEIGGKYPKNYGWFQCRWHIAAGEIYDKAGDKAAVRLWNILRQTKNKLDDAGLSSLLKKKVHKSVASVMDDWEKNTR